jgi:hypothetical protein
MIVAILGLLVCFEGSARAEDAQLLGVLGGRKANSVTKVMRNAGCSFSWLSQVLADSNISPDPKKLRNLKPGQKVLLKNGSCKQDAPVQVGSLSRVILQMHSPNQTDKEVKKLQGELASLRAATSTQRMESLVAEKETLRLHVIDLEKELDRLKKAVPNAEAQRGKGSNNPYTLAGVGLLGLMLGLVILYRPVWLTKRMGTEMISVRRQITKHGDDGQWSFTLCGLVYVAETGKYEPMYKCSRCPECRLYGYDSHLENHMRANVTGHVQHRTVIDVDPKLRPPKEASRAAASPFDRSEFGKLDTKRDPKAG